MAFDRSKTELERVCADGEIIVREGDDSREMYVINKGSVEITVGAEQLVIATLHKGDFFGEMSLLESLPRAASVRAVGETRLLVIQPGGLLLRIRRDPTFAFEMLHKLSGRVRRQNGRLVRALEALEARGAADVAASILDDELGDT